MKKTILATTLSACLLLAGCGSTDNPTPAPAPNPAPTNTNVVVTPTPITSTADADIEAALPLIRIAAATATGAVLQFAVSQASTRTQLANEMYTAASSVYSLSGGTFPTVAQFQANILAFGGSTTDANYATFSTSLAGLYASYYPKLVSGNVTSKTVSDLFNAIAGGVEDATASYVTVPAPTATATASLVAPKKK